VSPRPVPVVGLPLLAILGLASPSWAASAQDQAAAYELFRAGKQLAAAGDFEHACPKLVESQRLDPTSGTLLSIGDCYEKLGKLASAYGAFREAEVSARGSGDRARQAEAIRRAEILAPQIAHLAITVPPAARVPGFELKKDGTVVGEGQWGASLPIDVGYHELVATAPGYKPWSSTIRIDNNGSAASVQVQPLEKQSDTASPLWNGQRIAGVAVGSIGIVGAIVGGALGGVALAKNSASKQDCSPTNPNSCTQAGASLRSEAITAGNASTAGLVLGGALFTTGIVLFATAAPSKKSADAGVEILPGVGALAFRGRF
jgi:hypothetical protein